MDKLKVTKVDHVLIERRQSTAAGTLHLTAHHLIFLFASANASAASGCEEQAEQSELWVPYPLVSLVTRLPPLLAPSLLPSGASSTFFSGTPSSSSQDLSISPHNPLKPPHGPRSSNNARIYPLAFRLRNFESFALGFANERDVDNVFESVKGCAVASSIDSLYAFTYTQPTPPSPVNGWKIYDFKREYTRQGVGTRTKAWRFTDINSKYEFCSTYPAQLVVPSRISDATLGYAARYRSKARIPALSYLHWANYGSITRSSQPMVGIKQNRSIQDEKLIEAIFTSHHFAEPHSKAALAAASSTNTAAVYGATTTNLIIDARPTTNAMANVARGAGTENMEHYKGCKKAYLGVDNIHVMRDSLNRINEALRESEAPPSFGSTSAGALNTVGTSQPPPLDQHALRRSNWLRHLTAILEGATLITRNVHVYSSHVLIHCSDGWDRTAQLASLSELCLDPYFRTLNGFAVLVEKDWLSFGHRFADRCGHLSSERFFLTAPGYGASTKENGTPEGGEIGGGGFDTSQAQAAATAFWGQVQKQLFQSQSHVKETSPVFHQFLDCVHQLMRQFPDRFEFNGRFLRTLHYHLYSCQYGTFLFSTERDRRLPGENGRGPAAESTVSMWDEVLAPGRRDKFLNPAYDPGLDDPKSRREGADQGVLLADPKDVRYWYELFGRGDEEMNALVDAERRERQRLREEKRLERERLAAVAAVAVAGKQAEGDDEANGEDVAGTQSRPEALLTGPIDSSSEDPVLGGKAPPPTPPPPPPPKDLSAAAAGGGDGGLAYQPRVKQRPDGWSSSTTGSSIHSSADGGMGAPRSPVGSPARYRQLSPSQAPESRSSSPSPSASAPFSPPPSAAEAAARMKNMFLGGWARVQTAVSNVGAGVVAAGAGAGYEEEQEQGQGQGEEGWVTPAALTSGEMRSRSFASLTSNTSAKDGAGWPSPWPSSSLSSSSSSTSVVAAGGGPVPSSRLTSSSSMPSVSPLSSGGGEKTSRTTTKGADWAVRSAGAAARGSAENPWAARREESSARLFVESEAEATGPTVVRSPSSSSSTSSSTTTTTTGSAVPLSGAAALPPPSPLSSEGRRTPGRAAAGVGVSLASSPLRAPRTGTGSEVGDGDGDGDRSGASSSPRPGGADIGTSDGGVDGERGRAASSNVDPLGVGFS